jgi:hypothetical protein
MTRVKSTPTERNATSKRKREKRNSNFGLTALDQSARRNPRRKTLSLLSELISWTEMRSGLKGKKRSSSA